MKKALIVASLAAMALVGGCNDNKDTSNTSSGNMGVVGETHKDSCCSQKSDGGSMGVMSESKDGHCESKTGCSKTGACPMDKKQN